MEDKFYVYLLVLFYMKDLRVVLKGKCFFFCVCNSLYYNYNNAWVICVHFNKEYNKMSKGHMKKLLKFLKIFMIIIIYLYTNRIPLFVLYFKKVYPQSFSDCSQKRSPFKCNI